MNAEWWSAIGTIVATLILIVPGVVYAYYVLDLMSADPNRYATVLREVEAREALTTRAGRSAPARTFGSETRELRP